MVLDPIDLQRLLRVVYDALVEPPSPREVNYVADGVFLPLRYHHKFDNVVYLIH